MARAGAGRPFADGKELAYVVQAQGADRHIEEPVDLPGGPGQSEQLEKPPGRLDHLAAGAGIESVRGGGRAVFMSGCGHFVPVNSRSAKRLARIYRPIRSIRIEGIKPLRRKRKRNSGKCRVVFKSGGSQAAWNGESAFVVMAGVAEKFLF